MDLTLSNINRIIDHKFKKRYLKHGQAYYMVREADFRWAKCIYIYKTEFGHITKSVGDINSMEESTREEFTDVDLLTNLDEMDNLDPIEKAKFTTVLFAIACLLAAIISFLT